MVNLEIEYKVLVSKSDFERLEKQLTIPYKLFDQTNYYFDSKKQILNSQGYSLRIRRYSDCKYITTLKVKALEGRYEFEYETDKKELATEVVEKLINKGFDINSLEELASLRTIRKEYKVSGGLLCLDISHYNGQTDYEIECESDSMTHAKEIISQLLDQYNISYVESKQSKQQLALNK